MTRAWNPTLQWMEDAQESRHGEGISRPVSTARTRRFVLVVKHPNQFPMTVTMKAESQSAAIRYAKARWPHALVKAA